MDDMRRSLLLRCDSVSFDFLIKCVDNILLKCCSEINNILTNNEPLNPRIKCYEIETTQTAYVIIVTKCQHQRDERNGRLSSVQPTQLPLTQYDSSSSAKHVL